jgi:hypothetical protein
MSTTLQPSRLDDDTIRLLCDAVIMLYRRSMALAKATGNPALHEEDLAMIRALDRAGWHGDRYDGVGPCPVCGRTDRTRHAGFHRPQPPRGDDMR